jgi:L-histidine Nalpha-methyltransferase
MEIYLVSRVAQIVNIAGINLKIDFSAGETIHTENSYKYDMVQLAALAQKCGFRNDRSWFDSQNRFSCNFWKAV